MPVYYMELNNGGDISFPAKDDESAIKRLTKSATMLYRESDTETGLPFVTLFKREENTDD